MTASLLSRVAAPVALNNSSTKNAPATDVFLVNAMKTLIKGGTTMRPACGKTTSVTVCANPIPMLRAASACPTGTPLIPDRIASATNGEVYAVSPIAARVK